MPPDNGSSVDMWRRYHQKESVDIAVIGSSLASCALHEEDLAAATGKTVSLMATNAQSWDMSQIALETLLQEHTPERVILVMDPSNMTCDPYPKAQKAFLYAELQTAEPKDIPAEFLHYVTSSGNFMGADSLNAFSRGRAADGRTTGLKKSVRKLPTSESFSRRALSTGRTTVRKVLSTSIPWATRTHGTGSGIYSSNLILTN